MGLVFQCRLKKENKEQIAWIPGRGAYVHAVLELKTEEDGDKDGWEVIEVMGEGKNEEYIRERSQDYKYTRKASDI